MKHECPNREKLGPLACNDASKCWEPCGDLGQEAAAALARSAGSFRFIVFGVSPTDGDTMIENHTNDILSAAQMWDVMSTADYTARVYDREKQGFLVQTVINLVLKTLSQ